MKVFYKLIEDDSTKLMNCEPKVEELELPDSALKELGENLQSSTNILPALGRSHQDWTVGLLQR